ncbi:MAG: ABC transporter ATP-binding protein [Candidatus Bathyarchaeia archaeon]
MNNDLLRAENLGKYFPIKRSFIEVLKKKPQKHLRAVDGVTFNIKEGEILALVGESGCGKTTTGRLILRLIEPTFGRVLFEGKDVLSLNKNELKKFRMRAQIIFQDPYESLNPRMHVYATLSEPLIIHKVVSTEAERLELVMRVMEEVGLTPPEEFLFRFPHQLSGGQRQRVALASALILNPKFIVADEPVSMVDMSMRASILNVFLDMKEKRGMSCLFITHDLAMAKYVSDRIAIMYLGKIVEVGKATEVVDNPLHPYAKALIEAVPSPNPKIKMRNPTIKDEIPSPIDLPPSCRFYNRCSYAKEKCKYSHPDLINVDKEHYVACYLYHDEEEKGTFN